MEKIKIMKLGRKQQPSKYKQGETYSITTIMDEKGRKLSAIGKWSDDWKVGDEVEAEITEKKWTDRDGFEQTNLTLVNPNQKPFIGGGGGGGFRPNPIVQAYEIAAQLAPLLFAGKKKVKLDDIGELAEEIKKRIDTAAPVAAQEVKKDVPEIDVKEEKETPAKADSDFDDDEEDEKPF